MTPREAIEAADVAGAETAYRNQLGREMYQAGHADGDDEDVYRICATGDRPLPRKAWNKATRLCNDWNNEHRWPKASVLKLKRENRSVAFVELNADIPVRHGASRRMLDDFTGRVVYGTFEFFKWLHEQREPLKLTPAEPAADF